MEDGTESNEVLTFLGVWTRRLGQHHQALLEEEKHYTWWIYIIFGALIFIYANPYISLTNLKLALVSGGCLF
jgi:hypothetical protein